MYLLRDYRLSLGPATGEQVNGAVFALGNFDGVHNGHRAVIAHAKTLSKQLGVPAGVVTFEPHPRNVFAPQSPPFRLTPFRIKFRRLRELDLNLLACLRFNQGLYGKTAQDFVRDVLVEGLGAGHVVVGYDFVFGKDRGGDVSLLQSMGKEHGFGVTVVEPVSVGEDVCSSTIIRVNLETGRVRRAAELLQHWWEVEGRVRSGDQRGRQIGFATANLHLNRRSLCPALGVYAVYLGIPQDKGGTVWHQAVANLGTRPTFDGKGIVLEVHILDFEQDIYHRHVRVAFVEHLRNERKFEGIDALVAQIGADRDQARELLARPENRIEAFRAGNGS